jgi:hypothetical protein
MTKKQLNEYKKRFSQAAELGITVPEVLLTEEKIRGIYGIYKIDEDSETCIYIGKSNNILVRLLGGDGHVNAVIKGYLGKDVPKQIKEQLDGGYKVEAKIIKRVPYDRKKSFEYNANYLCYMEIKALLDMQSIGQCEGQLYEAVKKDEIKDWEMIAGKD